MMISLAYGDRRLALLSWILLVGIITEMVRRTFMRHFMQWAEAMPKNVRRTFLGIYSLRAVFLPYFFPFLHIYVFCCIFIQSRVFVVKFFIALTVGSLLIIMQFHF
jgi:hypothetical protein